MVSCEHCQKLSEQMGEMVLCLDCLMKEEIIKLRRELATANKRLEFYCATDQLMCELREEKAQLNRELAGAREEIMRVRRMLNVAMKANAARSREAGEVKT